MNPARWLGPAAVSGVQGNAVVYIAGPILGAVIGALLYQLSLAGPKAEREGALDEGS